MNNERVRCLTPLLLVAGLLTACGGEEPVPDDEDPGVGGAGGSAGGGPTLGAMLSCAPGELELDDGRRGTVQLAGSERFMEGLACDLTSPGLLALEEAMRRVRGADGVNRLAVTFALPLVRDLQRRGFDVQIVGFGVTGALHAPDEYARIEDFAAGYAILRELLDRL